MEGEVHICRWEKLKQGYRLWLPAHPQISSVSADFEDAAELLAERICSKLGDGEAVLEFEPAAPKPAGGQSWYEGREILVLGGNGWASGQRKQPELYSNGYCTKCGYGMGGRTEVPLLINECDASDKLIVRNTSPSLELYSREFIDLLHPEETAQLKFIAVERTNKAGKKAKQYYELVGESVAPFVSVAGNQIGPLNGWSCPVCEIKVYGIKHPEIPGTIVEAVAMSDLPTPLPGAFVVGGFGRHLSFCMTAERWGQIRGKKGAKGISTSPIGVIADDRVVRNPDLPLRR